MQVLIVEDDSRMSGLLRQALSEEGHQVVTAGNGQEGFEIAQCSPFDVIVLDLMLPGMDGFTVARRLRQNRNQTPLLMLTARDTPADIVNGLDCGADDYLTKPFLIEVLLARLRSVSRRGVIPRPVRLEVGDLSLDPATHRVTRSGIEQNLTPREYQLLELLMRNAGRVISRETILDSVWGFGTEIAGNTLEVFMRQLRLKVDNQQPKFIQTVRGFGYMLKDSR